MFLRITVLPLQYNIITSTVRIKFRHKALKPYVQSGTVYMFANEYIYMDTNIYLKVKCYDESSYITHSPSHITHGISRLTH